MWKPQTPYIQQLLLKQFWIQELLAQYILTTMTANQKKLGDALFPKNTMLILGGCRVHQPATYHLSLNVCIQAKPHKPVSRNSINACVTYFDDTCSVDSGWEVISGWFAFLCSYFPRTFVRNSLASISSPLHSNSYTSCISKSNVLSVMSIKLKW